MIRIFPDFDLMWLSDETKANLPIELDFRNEVKNCQKAQKNLRCFDWVKVSSRVLLRWLVFFKRFGAAAAADFYGFGKTRVICGTDCTFQREILWCYITNAPLFSSQVFHHKPL